ncbi:MAG TPA: hypothetical protein VKI17_01550 [Gemmataceae bacterium]|nr:hypothetical protein [Gemmataceae bacterium]
MFLPDGRHALILREEGALEHWDLDKGQVLAQIGDNARHRMNNIVLSADGRSFIASHHYGWVIWDINTAQPLKQVSFDAGRFANRVAWSKDERLAVTATDVIRTWDVQQGKELNELPGHADGTTSLALSPDGTRLLTGGAKNPSKIYSVKSTIWCKLSGTPRKGWDNGHTIGGSRVRLCGLSRG